MVDLRLYARGAFAFNRPIRYSKKRNANDTKFDMVHRGVIIFGIEGNQLFDSLVLVVLRTSRAFDVTLKDHAAE